MNEAPRPMLALSYTGTPPVVGFSQPKLDGVRALASREGLWTRGGVRIRSCSHVEAALAPFFAKHPFAILDGELYTHDLKDDLGRIISLVRARSRPMCPTDAVASALQFHVFDLADAQRSFADRWNWLAVEWAPQLAGPLRFVETTQVRSSEEADALFAWYLASGFEGQMLRLDLPYETRRSSALLKRKPFMDEEFPIMGIEPVRGGTTAYAKRVTLALPDGRTFKAGIAGSHEYAANLLSGCFARATVRYSSRSRNGIPRSPVAVAFHASSRLD